MHKCERACQSRAYICTQYLALFLSFNLQYCLKCKHYDNEILCLICKSIRKQTKLTEHEYHNKDQEKYHFLNMRNLCRYAQFSQAQSQILILTFILIQSIYYHLEIGLYNLAEMFEISLNH